MAEDQLNATSTSLEARILIALRTAPRPAIPEGFAARVASQLPPRPALLLPPPRYGVAASTVCVVLLMAIMVAFAHGAPANSLYFLIIESILCLQFVLLTLGILARNAGYTLPS